MSIIDNDRVIFLDEIKNALPSADRLDIQTGYFYFSGFSELADSLKDINMRVIVGMDIDPKLVVAKKITENYDLSRARGDEPLTETAKIQNYRESFLALMNNTDLFDEDRLTQSIDIFFQKIIDGSLEIKMNLNPQHGKYYVLHNKPEYSHGGSFKGLRFMGSSNFTLAGLKGQGEIMEVSRQTDDYEEYANKFQGAWDDAKSVPVLDKHLAKEFVSVVKENSAIFNEPTPYQVYVRILKELFDIPSKKSIKTPSQLTAGKYKDFEYQSDAIKQGLSILNTYGGALIADVVGLGKSIIASGIAANLNLKTIVIAPPHLVKQWEDYSYEFGYNTRVYSSGRIEAAIKENNYDTEQLVIVDEAHRYRNEDTFDYQSLHKLCLNKKVLLLTATPFNNDPKDVFALVKLFDTPSQSRINTVENLSIEFRELIIEYKKLRDKAKKLDEKEIHERTEKIAIKMRQMIEPILIRRSRLDLKRIDRYNTDLISQGYEMSDVLPPKLLEFELGNLAKLYFDTLEKISDPDQGFSAARYQSAKFIADDKKFAELMKNYYNNVDDFTQAQVNLAKFMRRFLVMRFESSIAAFKSTLDNFIANHELIVQWWEKFEYVPVYKKGKIPDPANLELLYSDSEVSEQLSEDALKDALKSPQLSKDVKRGLILIPASLMKKEFISNVRRDIELLKSLKQDWFIDNKIHDDPKIDNLTVNLQKLISENKDRKIIIFTAYTDTADYVHKHLKDNGFRIFEYTGASSTSNNKECVKANFDAGLEAKLQKNDYEILIATDAISEGYNLHRAGVIFNYDIPYNPVRVVQRVGRINRINKRVFKELLIFNSFPTAIGENEVQTKRISTLKVHLMNTLYGSDTQVLTDDEQLESFFVDTFNEEVERDESESWDAKYRNLWDKLKYDKSLANEIANIKQRSFLARKHNQKGMLLYGQKGLGASIFVTNIQQEMMTRVSAEEILEFFESEKEEKSISKSPHFKEQFIIGKSKLFKKDRLPDNKGRRGDAINVLDLIIQNSENSQIKAHARDARKIITELDGFPEGTLKRINELAKDYLIDNDYSSAFETLKEIAPQDYMQAIYGRANALENEPESLLIAEELL
jgi:superfamily II DNA or RNA helicase